MATDHGKQRPCPSDHHHDRDLVGPDRADHDFDPTTGDRVVRDAAGTPAASAPAAREAAALDSLEGLATGDAFGAQFFVPDNMPVLHRRKLPPPVWPWTDDTETACSVLAVLRAHGTVDQDRLAASLARRHDADRGYGPATGRLLHLVRTGGRWRELAAALFDGQGSWGNGAAMRVAPLGAWFAGDPAEAARQAARSSEVTHTHPEAVAGAVAVAVAAAVAARSRPGPLRGRDLLEAVLGLTPPGRVHDGVAEARMLAGRPDPEFAAYRLGNGRLVSAADTVPFALWCAARHPDDYERALWTAASVGGDVDTTCAIVGGVVGARVGRDGVPAVWRRAREPLPGWLDGDDQGAGPAPCRPRDTDETGAPGRRDGVLRTASARRREGAPVRRHVSRRQAEPGRRTAEGKPPRKPAPERATRSELFGVRSR